MESVVKSMIEEEPDDDKRGLNLFGRDLSKIPCFRESFMYGIMSGIGVGLATFVKTSKPLLSQHMGVGGFTVTTLVYWAVCRYQWSKQKMDAMILQEALKEKMLYEGTAMQKELEQKGIFKTI